MRISMDWTVALFAVVLAVPGIGGAVLPADHGLAVGPPSRLLGFDARQQARMTASSAPFARLVAAEGGRWAVRWDEWTGQARTLLAPGTLWSSADAAVEAAAFLARHEALLGVPTDQLVPGRDAIVGDRRYLSFAQVYRGVPVAGAAVEFRLRVVEGGDRLSMVRNRALRLPEIDVVPGIPASDALRIALADLSPQRLDVLDPGTLVVFGGDPGSAPRPALAWRSRVWVPDGPVDRIAYVDAHTGAVLYCYDDVRRDIEGTIQVAFEERTVDDPLVIDAVPGIEVIGSSGAVHTDAAGAFSLALGAPEDLETAMRGAFVELVDEIVPGIPVATFAADVGAGNDFTWTGGEASLAARDVLAHYERVRQYVQDREPSFQWTQELVPATVNIASGSCNAFYTQGTINFYVEDPSGWCVNFGRISDVVYHEYGHGVHHYIMEAGGWDGSLSEGSADYLSATIWDDPYMAVGAYGPGTWIRELDTDMVYPDDLIGEVHHDGLIWGSAMWDIREEMIALYGYEQGVATADALFFGTLRGGPSLTGAYDELIYADDDDGDLTNGTPHLCLLTEQMGDHGLGPGDLGYFIYGHDPLGPQPGSAGSYPVEASFEVVEPACSDFDAESVTLHHAMDPTGPFTDLGMTWDGATGYSAEIPGHPKGATVYYYLSATDEDGDTLYTTHDEDPEYLYRFLVGDFQVISCDDGESGEGDFVHLLGTPDAPEPGDDDWELGTPQGLSSDPDHAYSGDACWGTNHGNGDHGEYSNNMLQFLLLPEADVGGFDRIRLQYRRWLAVEDGFYDHARLQVNGNVLWENPATPGGGTHFLDTEWVLHDEYVDPFVGEDETLSIAWTLDSDQGLEFGGWNVDDVCLIAPDDLGEWYAVDDFQAGDREERQSTLTWSHPFTEPLWAVAVVRNNDHYPQDLDDGVIVFLDTEPVWGEPVEVVDSDLEPARTYYYVVFAADEEWSWRSSLIEGWNADTAETAGPSDDDDDSADDDDTVGDDDTAWGDDDLGAPPEIIESSCACRSDGGSAHPLAVLALCMLAALRRRG